MTTDRHRFKRRRRFRPWLSSSRSLCPDADIQSAEAAPEPSLCRPRPFQRPCRFAVGLHTFAPCPIREDLAICQSAPLDPAAYLGRVEEVADDGVVTARIWEYPSGRESLTTLTPEVLDQPETHPGATLRIWTWMEAPARGSGAPIPRLHVEVRNRQALTREEDEKLAHLIALLSGDTSGADED